MISPIRLMTPAGLMMAALVLGAPGAAAQIQASEHAVTTQTVDGTTLTLEYSRPQVRGRDVYGGIVPWNVVWTPGANWATTFSTDSDITVQGVDVPAGTYSVWAIPRPERFTITFNPTDSIFHFMKPDSSAEQIHVSAEPEAAPHAEMLTWAFPAVSGDAATLVLRWSETAVPLQVMVPPSKPVTLTADEMAMYTGEYDLTITPGIGWPTEARLEVFGSSGEMQGRLPFGMHPGDDPTFGMVPAGTDTFNPGLIHNGALHTIEMGVIIEFTDTESGHAQTLEMRSPNGFHLGSGTRVR